MEWQECPGHRGLASIFPLEDWAQSLRGSMAIDVKLPSAVIPDSIYEDLSINPFTLYRSL